METLESNSKKALLGVFLLAVLLRLWGIWHGYPYSFYPDEAHFVKRALSFGSGDFNPHWFHKPAFYMYLLFFEYGLFFLVGKLLAVWGSVSEFAVLFIKNPGPFYIIGRVTTTLFGLGTIWVAYLIGERHFRKSVGIVAALLLSVSYGHVAASQDIKADFPTVFFLALSIFFLLNYVSSKYIKDFILASMFAGIGTATKAYPIIMLPILVVAVILVQNERETNSTANKTGTAIALSSIGIFVFYLSYFVCAPYNFIDPLGRETTFGPFFKLVRTLSPIFGGDKVVLVHPGDFIGQRMGLFQGAVDYLRKLINTDGMGIVVFGVGILGVLYLIIRRPNKRNFIFLSYPILFAIISVITNPGYAEPRHQFPIYLFLAVSGGAFVVWLAEMSHPRQWFVYGLILICLSWPLFSIIERDIFISRTDTRNIAKAWIENNIPAGSKLLMNENGPRLMKNEDQLKELMDKAKQAIPTGQFTAHYDTYTKYQILAAKDSITYDIQEIRFPWWRESEIKEGVHMLTSDYDADMGNPLKPVGVKAYSYYLKNSYEYAIVSSEAYGSFFIDNQVSRNFPSFKRFYKELFEKGNLIKEFSPKDGNRPGPVVKIFQLTS